jgi:DNA mismatch endonuclease (patch repair protein)
MPKSRVDFWTTKFQRNVARDEKVEQALTDLGWRVCVVWECETNDSTTLEMRLRGMIGK